MEILVRNTTRGDTYTNYNRRDRNHKKQLLAGRTVQMNNATRNLKILSQRENRKEVAWGRAETARKNALCGS